MIAYLSFCFIIPICILAKLSIGKSVDFLTHARPRRKLWHVLDTREGGLVSGPGKVPLQYKWTVILSGSRKPGRDGERETERERDRERERGLS